MVRLKDLIFSLRRPPQYYFNSKMVRLKEPPAKATARTQAEFQFQNGAIKRKETYHTL